MLLGCNRYVCGYTGSYLKEVGKEPETDEKNGGIKIA